MQGLTAVGLFVVSLLFSLLIFSIWLRLALHYFHISALHPLSQLVRTVTAPLVDPIETLLGKKTKPGQKYDLATGIALIFVEVVKITILSLIALHGLMPLGYFILYLIADLIIQPCDLIFYGILIRVIMSFVKPDWKGPIAESVFILTEPFLKFGRKIIPNVSGFDFSPFIILMLLQVITLFVKANLPWRLL